jgi:hypothetical protein
MIPLYLVKNSTLHLLIMRIKDPITLTTTVDTLNYDDASTPAQSIPSSMRTQLKENK